MQFGYFANFSGEMLRNKMPHIDLISKYNKLATSVRGVWISRTFFYLVGHAVKLIAGHVVMIVYMYEAWLGKMISAIQNMYKLSLRKYTSYARC